MIKHFFGLDSAHTQTTAKERDAIKRHAFGRRQAVEIGVYEGVTTGVIASVLDPDATLFAVDPFLPGRIGICWCKQIARREANRYSPKCRIQFVEKFSHDAHLAIDGTFDFVFIDGDHSWNGIAQDWNDWSGRIEQGGLIAIHDSLVPEHDPSVASLGSHKFFTERIQHDDRFEVIEQVDSLSILVRVDSDKQD